MDNNNDYFLCGENHTFIEKTGKFQFHSINGVESALILSYTDKNYDMVKYAIKVKEHNVYAHILDYQTQPLNLNQTFAPKRGIKDRYLRASLTKKPTRQYTLKFIEKRILIKGEIFLEINLECGTNFFDTRNPMCYYFEVEKTEYVITDERELKINSILLPELPF